MYARHCSTEFKKQVLPILDSPAPIERTLFQHILRSSPLYSDLQGVGTTSESGVVLELDVVESVSMETSEGVRVILFKGV